MGLASDLKILYHLAFKPVRGKDHAARMESFYAGQADGYDDFRKRLLQGREQLWQSIEVPEGGRWIDMGAGTGANLEYFGDSISKLEQVYAVDLSRSLLDVAEKRFEANGWTNASVLEADATNFEPPGGLVDVVTFSYSLTMIPDWFAAIENALRILKPGGCIGVVDFYVSRKHPQGELTKHNWFTRNFWPTWFSSDNVFPSADHVPMLHHHLEVETFTENRAKVPYLPLIRVPYYTFVGRKRT